MVLKNAYHSLNQFLGQEKDGERKWQCFMNTSIQKASAKLATAEKDTLRQT
jgi:hypothetical protein